MGIVRRYEENFKKQAVTLANELGVSAAATELDIPKATLGTWLRKSKEGQIDTDSVTLSPKEAAKLVQQLQAATKRIKDLEKKNRKLEEMNTLLKEASAFFAANSRMPKKEVRLEFIAQKTNNGNLKGKTKFYCQSLNVSRQAFYDYLERKNNLHSM